jgi:glycosyltransferase involved in cell wall biosynthesis
MVAALSRHRPRALMIAPAMPAETGNGLAMRLGVFLEALSRIADVDLAVLPVAGRVAGLSPLVEGLGIRAAVIGCDRPDTHFALLSRLEDPKARLEAFVRYGRPRLSARLTAPVLQELGAMAAGRNYALVHVGRTYFAPAAQSWIGSGTALSLDLDEDDCETSNSIARLNARRGCWEAAAWARAEAAAYDRLIAEVTPWFDRLWISSPLDRRRVQARHPAAEPLVVPNTVPEVKRRPRLDDGATLVFVGSFGYLPNVDAVLWFVQTAWPVLRARIPRLRLLVLGPDPPTAILALRNRPGIVVTGRVADLGAVYARASLALVPLRAGGGTRIKLLEALSQGVAVVTTQIGAAGLPVARSRCGWIADGPEQFAAACLSALADAPERHRRGARGRALVRRDYARSGVLARLACSFAALSTK